MRREAGRTLYSLSTNYQHGVNANSYEVIAIDNGSAEPLSESMVRSYGENFHYRFYSTTSISPVEATNDAVRKCRGNFIMVMIDGAHILSPGVIANTFAAFSAYENPFVATVPFHLGAEVQNRSILKGYNQSVEDRLLATQDWKADGYRLFLLTGSLSDGSMGWFGRLFESNCFALTKGAFLKLGGFSEGFKARGGGLVNLDFFAQALSCPDLTYVLLLGEGTFHQFHGGVASNAPANAHPWNEFHNEFVAIRGRSFATVPRRPILLGRISPSATRIALASANLGLNWWQHNDVLLERDFRGD